MSEDYASRRAQENKVKRDLYVGLATQLGPERWEVIDCSDPDNDFHTVLRLRDKLIPHSELNFPIGNYGADKGKVTIDGSYPYVNGHGVLGPSSVCATDPAIKCSLSRGYAAIARDIERRFLPEYRRIYALCLASANKQIAYDTLQASNELRLKVALKPHGYGVRARMDSADSVAIELRSVPIKRALEILAAMLKEGGI
jgi:hypothetical protein